MSDERLRITGDEPGIGGRIPGELAMVPMLSRGSEAEYYRGMRLGPIAEEWAAFLLGLDERGERLVDEFGVIYEQAVEKELRGVRFSVLMNELVKFPPRWALVVGGIIADDVRGPLAVALGAHMGMMEPTYFLVAGWGSEIYMHGLRPETARVAMVEVSQVRGGPDSRYARTHVMEVGSWQSCLRLRLRTVPVEEDGVGSITLFPAVGESRRLVEFTYTKGLRGMRVESMEMETGGLGR